MCKALCHIVNIMCKKYFHRILKHHIELKIFLSIRFTIKYQIMPQILFYLYISTAFVFKYCIQNKYLTNTFIIWPADILFLSLNTELSSKN